MKQTGLFIGRFQPFHLGHLSGVRYGLKQVKHLYIIVGSSQRSHEPRNPFTAGERIIMIRNALIEEKIDASRYLIIPIPDAAGHSVWTASIDQVVPSYDIVFSNDPLTLQLFKEKSVPTSTTPLFNRQTLSATEVRRRIVEGEEWKGLVHESSRRMISNLIRKGRFGALE
jgi:nicotinamide-nucleotide adenylyltransferase